MKKLYLWSMNVKLFMGIYFSAIVFLSGILTAILGGTYLTLLTLLEMLGVSIIIAAAQSIFLPDHVEFSKKAFAIRSACWILLSAAIITAAGVLGGWFEGLWYLCPYLLGTFMLIGLIAILIGFKLEQEADTLRLNLALQNYKKN